MNLLSNLRARPWLMAALLIAFLAGHALALHFMWHSGKWHLGFSGALVSAVILVVVAKHVGMFAALLRPFHGWFRRRLRGRAPRN